MLMAKITSIACGGVLALALVAPHAVMAEPAAALRFADLEAGMQPYRQFASALPNWQDIPTPVGELQQAYGALRTAIPVGLAAAEAQDRLRAAGGRCTVAAQGTLMCTYGDVEHTNDFIDHVNWRVTVPVADGHVADIKVARDWYRE